MKPDATIFNFQVKLEKKTLICFAAFYGSVHVLAPKRLSGVFSRSEYLSEIIVSDGENIETAIDSYGELLKIKLRKNGLVVI